MANNTYTFETFLSNCTACGGNWTQMFLTGIKACWPSIYDAMPDWSYEFDEVCFIVETLCSDKDTTFCGVHVNKHLSVLAPTHFIEVKDGQFIFTLLDEAPAMSYDAWYIQECCVDPVTIKEYEAQMQREQNIKDCSSIVWNLCHAWHEGNGTGLYLDNSKVYEWLLDQDDFVNEAQAAKTRDELNDIVEQWFDDEVLEQPSSLFIMNW